MVTPTVIYYSPYFTFHIPDNISLPSVDSRPESFTSAQSDWIFPDGVPALCGSNENVLFVVMQSVAFIRSNI